MVAGLFVFLSLINSPTIYIWCDGKPEHCK